MHTRRRRLHTFTYRDSHNYWPRRARVSFSSARVNNCGNLSNMHTLTSWRFLEASSLSCDICDSAEARLYCMYVCMYVSLCVCMYVCTYVHMYVCDICYSAEMRFYCMYTYIYGCMHSCEYVIYFTCTCIGMPYMCVNVSVHINCLYCRRIRTHKLSIL